MGVQQDLRATFTKGTVRFYVAQVITDAGALGQSPMRLIILFQCWVRECYCVF